MKSAGRGSRDSDRGSLWGLDSGETSLPPRREFPGGESAGSLGAAEFGLALN